MVFVDVFCVVVLSLLCFLVFCLAIGLLVFYRGAGAAAFGTVQYVQCVRVSTVYFDSVQVSMLRYVSVQVNTFCFITNQYVFGQVNTFQYNAVRGCTNPETSRCFSTKKHKKQIKKIHQKTHADCLKTIASMSGHCVKSPGFTAGRVDPINQLCHLIEGIL